MVENVFRACNSLQVFFLSNFLVLIVSETSEKTAKEPKFDRVLTHIPDSTEPICLIFELSLTFQEKKIIETD